MFGFGTWNHLQARTPDGLEMAIRVCFFGVSEEHKSARNAADERCADLLYAALEADALAHPDSTADMPLELLCDVVNERGLRFWRSHHYESVGIIFGHYHYMRR